MHRGGVSAPRGLFSVLLENPLGKAGESPEIQLTSWPSEISDCGLDHAGDSVAPVRREVFHGQLTETAGGSQLHL